LASVFEQKITWQDFATVKNWKKRLKKRAHNKQLSQSTWKIVGLYFPKFLKLSKKNPDELIEESLIDPEKGEERIDNYFDVLEQMISHNSARTICYGSIRGFYSHNKVNTKDWTISELHPSNVKDIDDNFPVWIHNEDDDRFELNRILFQDFFNRLNPTYRAIAYALIGSGQDVSDILKRNVGFVRNQDYRHERLSFNGNRSKTSEIIDGFYSIEATDTARSIVKSDRENTEYSDPLYVTSISQRKREFRKVHGRKFVNDGIDVLPPAKRLEIGSVEIAFRKAQRAMGIKLVKGQQSPLRPKRLRKIFRTAIDFAGLGDDKARQLLGQKTIQSSSVYLDIPREIKERDYMKVERLIWIFKEPESSAKERKTTKEIDEKFESMKKLIEVSESRMLDFAELLVDRPNESIDGDQLYQVSKILKFMGQKELYKKAEKKLKSDYPPVKVIDLYEKAKERATNNN